MGGRGLEGWWSKDLPQHPRTQGESHHHHVAQATEMQFEHCGLPAIHHLETHPTGHLRQQRWKRPPLDTWLSVWDVAFNSEASSRPQAAWTYPPSPPTPCVCVCVCARALSQSRPEYFVLLPVSAIAYRIRLKRPLH